MRLSDKLFLWTYLSPNDSGLCVETHVSSHLTHKRPTLLVGEYGREASVLIDDNPRLLRGSLEDDIKEEIFEWIRVNKEPLIKYWREEYCTYELLIYMKQFDLMKAYEEVNMDENKEELLSVEEEARLALQIQNAEGDVEAAKARLRNGNMRFVRVIAKQYATDAHPLDEIIAEGVKGLEAAMYKFDPSHGFKFISYAVWYIRQSIRQYLGGLLHNGNLPMDILSERERDILKMFLGIEREKATMEEICAKYELTHQRAIYIEQKALRKLFMNMNDKTTNHE